MPGPGSYISRNAQGVHRFAVTIPGDAVKGSATYFFKSARGLSRSFEVEKVAEGGRNFGHRSLWKGPASHGEVTLEHGFVSASSLWTWSRQVDSSTGFRKDVTIQHMSGGETTSDVVQTYTLVSAWPVSWSASDFDANSSTLAVITLKLAFDDLLVGLATSPAEPTKATLTTAEGPSKTVTFPINPNQLTLSRNVNWTGKETANAAYPPLAAPAAALDTLTINNLILDGGDTKTSISDTLVNLHRMSLATTITKYDRRPPLVNFTWKDTRFIGGISSFSANITMFSALGDPLRASVNLTLTGQYVAPSGTPGLKVAVDSKDAGGT